MAKYHVKSDGSFGVCRAEKGKCPLTANGEEVIHVNSKADAVRVSEALNEKKFGSSSVSGLKKSTNKLKVQEGDVDSSGAVAQYTKTSLGKALIWSKNGKKHRVDGPAVEYDNGTKEWYQNGVLHRVGGPAVEGNGDKLWCQNGKYHRVDGPAIEEADGTNKWFQNGELYRKDGPAVEEFNGDKEWYYYNLRHRVDGPAVVKANGDKEWWVNDKLHRVDGPAVENADGYKGWYHYNLRHRVDGPAVVKANGDKEYWLDDVKLSEAEYWDKVKGL